MTPKVIEDGDTIMIPVEGLSVNGVSIAIRMSTHEANALAESLDAAVDRRVLDSPEWEDGVSMRDVRRAEGEGAQLRYMDKGRKAILRIHGLKPCPFCGHRRPSIVMRCNRDLENPRIFKRIECGFCGAQTHDNAMDVLYHVKSWNRRVEP
ncbi:restriction alleviation protein, Lar family [Methanomassiliicoccaceae archaeon DOK]|nr:restriction alleviation protein, Lar family [Methanomassiliicoccaceae archaeon DOK]